MRTCVVLCAHSLSVDALGVKKGVSLTAKVAALFPLRFGLMENDVPFPVINVEALKTLTMTISSQP